MAVAWQFGLGERDEDLMKILYGARNARPDILKAVTHLACFFTKWTSQCDRRLHRLVCYI